jgi:signal recognition particle GTPase
LQSFIKSVIIRGGGREKLGKRKGIFITFEGGEGSGKTTHSRKTAEYLRKDLKTSTFSPGQNYSYMLPSGASM